METIKNILVSAVVATIVAVTVVMVGGNNQPVGATNSPTRFPNGYLDTGGGYYVDGTAIINGSGQISSFSSTDISNLFNAGSASTTVQIGGVAKAGCLILGDDDGSSVPVYFTANASGTASTLLVGATTTKPAACQTVQ
jgi:hypothetical protein